MGSGSALLTSVQLWQNACRVIILFVFPGDVHPDDVSVEFPGAHEMILKLRGKLVMGGPLFGEIMPQLSRVTFLEAGARLKIELEKDSTWHWPSLFHDQVAATSTVFHDLDEDTVTATAGDGASAPRRTNVPAVAVSGEQQQGGDEGESSEEEEKYVAPLIDLGIGGPPVRATKDPRRKSWAPSNTPTKTPVSPRKPGASPSTLAPPPAASSGSRLRRKSQSPTLPPADATRSSRRSARPKSMAISTPVDPDDGADEFEDFVRERSNSAATRPTLVSFSAMSLTDSNPFL